MFKTIPVVAMLAMTTGCATLTNDSNVPVALSFSDGSKGKCDLDNKRGNWSTKIPNTLYIRRSDDNLRYNCKTQNGELAVGGIPSTMGGKIIASAIFLDFGIVDALTDKHREYPASFVIPITGDEEPGIQGSPE
jgi:hypothetical protein